MLKKIFKQLGIALGLSSACPKCGIDNPESEIVKGYNSNKYSRYCGNCGTKY